MPCQFVDLPNGAHFEICGGKKDGKRLIKFRPKKWSALNNTTAKFGLGMSHAVCIENCGYKNAIEIRTGKLFLILDHIKVRKLKQKTAS